MCLTKGITFGFNDVKELNSPVMGLQKLPVEAEGLSRLKRLSPALGPKSCATCSKLLDSPRV